MAVATETTLEEVKKIAKGRGVEFFFAQFVDMYGRPSAKLIPAANIDDLPPPLIPQAGQELPSAVLARLRRDER